MTCLPKTSVAGMCVGVDYLLLLICINFLWIFIGSLSGDQLCLFCSVQNGFLLMSLSYWWLIHFTYFLKYGEINICLYDIIHSHIILSFYSKLSLFHYTCDVICWIWLLFLKTFLCWLLCTSTQCFLFTVHIFSFTIIVSLCIPWGFMCQNSLLFGFIFYVSVSNDCLLTPWSRALLEKLTGSQLVKKFPAFYGTWRFITAFTRVRHLSLISKDFLKFI